MTENPIIEVTFDPTNFIIIGSKSGEVIVLCLEELKFSYEYEETSEVRHRTVKRRVLKGQTLDDFLKENKYHR